MRSSLITSQSVKHQVRNLALVEEKNEERKKSEKKSEDPNDEDSRRKTEKKIRHNAGYHYTSLPTVDLLRHVLPSTTIYCHL